MGSILKKGLFLVTFSGAVATFPATAQAADAEYILPSGGIEEVLKSCYTAEKDIQVEDYLVPTKKGEYLDMAFANVDSFPLFSPKAHRNARPDWVRKTPFPSPDRNVLRTKGGSFPGVHSLPRGRLLLSEVHTPIIFSFWV